jgi:DNA polymerase-1
VLDSTQTHYGLDRLARDHLSYCTIRYSDIVDTRNGQTLESVDIAAVTDYAAEDADIAYRLYELFLPQLEERRLDNLFFEIEMPNVKVLAEMELAGIPVRQNELARLSREFEAELAQVEQEVYGYAGHPFNIGSTKQLQEVLFVERKLKPVKKTKTGWSTDSQVLEALADEDPVCAGVVKHRYLSKLKSTYVDALPALINPDTGRLHTHFIQTGTATGRLSSKDPNLQNIPIREAEGRKIRSAFTAPGGFTFLSADYSQIELVVLAELSGDRILQEAFRGGKDVHRQTAALLFGTDEASVSSQMRAIGKTINFGVIYGMSAFRLARDLRIARSEAELFIETYFKRYSGVRSFIDRIIEEAEERGYVQTLFGRQRPVPRIGSSNRTEKRAEERIAVNTSIQGSAADIIKKAMIDIHAALVDLRSRLVLQIHDELLLEVALEEREQVGRLVKTSMERAADLSIPVKVRLDEGENWGTLH